MTLKIEYENKAITINATGLTCLPKEGSATKSIEIYDPDSKTEGIKYVNYGQLKIALENIFPKDFPVDIILKAEPLSAKTIIITYKLAQSIYSVTEASKKTISNDYFLVFSKNVNITYINNFRSTTAGQDTLKTIELFIGRLLSLIEKQFWSVSDYRLCKATLRNWDKAFYIEFFRYIVPKQTDDQLEGTEKKIKRLLSEKFYSILNNLPYKNAFDKINRLIQPAVDNAVELLAIIAEVDKKDPWLSFHELTALLEARAKIGKGQDSGSLSTQLINRFDAYLKKMLDSHSFTEKPEERLDDIIKEIKEALENNQLENLRRLSNDTQKFNLETPECKITIDQFQEIFILNKKVSEINSDTEQDILFGLKIWCGYYLNYIPELTEYTNRDSNPLPQEFVSRVMIAIKSDSPLLDKLLQAPFPFNSQTLQFVEKLNSRINLERMIIEKLNLFFLRVTQNVKCAPENSPLYSRLFNVNPTNDRNNILIDLRKKTILSLSEMGDLLEIQDFIRKKKKLITEENIILNTCRDIVDQFWPTLIEILNEVETKTTLSLSEIDALLEIRDALIKKNRKEGAVENTCLEKCLALLKKFVPSLGRLEETNVSKNTQEELIKTISNMLKERQSFESTSEIKGCSEDMEKLLSNHFNINSTPQLAALNVALKLYKKLIPAQKLVTWCNQLIGSQTDLKKVPFFEEKSKADIDLELTEEQKSLLLSIQHDKTIQSTFLNHYKSPWHEVMPPTQLTPGKKEKITTPAKVWVNTQKNVVTRKIPKIEKERVECFEQIWDLLMDSSIQNTAELDIFIHSAFRQNFTELEIKDEEIQNLSKKTILKKIADKDKQLFNLIWKLLNDPSIRSTTLLKSTFTNHVIDQSLEKFLGYKIKEIFKFPEFRKAIYARLTQEGREKWSAIKQQHAAYQELKGTSFELKSNGATIHTTFKALRKLYQNKRLTSLTFRSSKDEGEFKYFEDQELKIQLGLKYSQKIDPDEIFCCPNFSSEIKPLVKEFSKQLWIASDKPNKPMTFKELLFNYFNNKIDLLNINTYTKPLEQEKFHELKTVLDSPWTLFVHRLFKEDPQIKGVLKYSPYDFIQVQSFIPQLTSAFALLKRNALQAVMQRLIESDLFSAIVMAEMGLSYTPDKIGFIPVLSPSNAKYFHNKFYFEGSDSEFAHVSSNFATLAIGYYAGTITDETLISFESLSSNSKQVKEQILDSSLARLTPIITSSLEEHSRYKETTVKVNNSENDEISEFDEFLVLKNEINKDKENKEPQNSFPNNEQNNLKDIQEVLGERTVNDQQSNIAFNRKGKENGTPLKELLELKKALDGCHWRLILCNREGELPEYNSLVNNSGVFNIPIHHIFLAFLGKETPFSHSLIETLINSEDRITKTLQFIDTSSAPIRKKLTVDTNNMINTLIKTTLSKDIFSLSHWRNQGDNSVSNQHGKIEFVEALANPETNHLLWETIEHDLYEHKKELAKQKAKKDGLSQQETKAKLRKIKHIDLTSKDTKAHSQRENIAAQLFPKLTFNQNSALVDRFKRRSNYLKQYKEIPTLGIIELITFITESSVITSHVKNQLATEASLLNNTNPNTDEKITEFKNKISKIFEPNLSNLIKAMYPNLADALCLLVYYFAKQETQKFDVLISSNKDKLRSSAKDSQTFILLNGTVPSDVTVFTEEGKIAHIGGEKVPLNNIILTEEEKVAIEKINVQEIMSAPAEKFQIISTIAIQELEAIKTSTLTTLEAIKDTIEKNKPEIEAVKAAFPNLAPFKSKISENFEHLVLNYIKTTLFVEESHISKSDLAQLKPLLTLLDPEKSLLDNPSDKNKLENVQRIIFLKLQKVKEYIDLNIINRIKETNEVFTNLDQFSNKILSLFTTNSFNYLEPFCLQVYQITQEAKRKLHSCLILSEKEIQGIQNSILQKLAEIQENILQNAGLEIGKMPINILIESVKNAPVDSEEYTCARSLAEQLYGKQ